MKQLIVITGPTASGKTSLAVQLAKRLHADVISADSRQFYKELTIGTAKPTLDEMEGIAHHFVGQISIHDRYTVGQYEREVLDFLHSYFETKDQVVLVGGSGLFVRAICEGLDVFPAIPVAIRTNLRTLYESKGLAWLQNEISVRDHDYFKKVDIKNPQRLLRALEVIETSGTTYSSFLRNQKVKRDFDIFKFGIDWERAALYDRINRRVDMMLDEGLLEEARGVYTYKDINALQTVGYAELFDHFDGRYDLDEAIRLIKRNTRRYAKKQLTWLRKEEGLIWLSSQIGVSEMVDKMVNVLYK